MKRQTRVVTDGRAGCLTCHGDATRWTGANAQAIAARHHDSTRHPTWCEVRLSVRYGTTGADDRQIDIEDAIRGSTT